MSPTWQFTVGARSATVSSAWGTTLDVNGDGYADVVIAAPNAGGNGSVYVYLGSPTGLGTAPATTLSGTAGSFFGNAVAGAGDVNGDGYADVVVGAPSSASSTGGAYIYLGSASGLGATPATTLISPDGAGSAFGFTVTGVGDLNGDGYADIAVGAPFASSGAGRVHLYLGGADGLATASSMTLTGPDGGAFGDSLAAAGDVNGDGFPDLAVAAPKGAIAYVYLGTGSALATAPATTLTGPDAGTPSGFGAALASVDANGDGYADIAVGATEISTSAGAVYVYLGGAAGIPAIAGTTLAAPDGANGLFGQVASAGDVNGDGYGDLVVGASAVGTEGKAYVYLGSPSGLAVATPTPLLGEQLAMGAFGFSVASAGDVTGNGFADVIIGAYGVSNLTGRAYLYLGGSSGVVTPFTVALTSPSGATGLFGNTVFGASY